MILVAILTIRQDFLEEYHAYERRAAEIMAKHGAGIERTVVVESNPNEATFKEVHILRFPNADALNAYKADPQLLELAPIREKLIVHTELLVGEDGPNYGGVVYS
ncbi:MAG: DUF1330 domain-containing protein [Chloroflexota bacterium]